MIEIKKKHSVLSNSKNTSRGFTLIELLTVIVIIMILAALLLPALSRAKYTAKIAVCASQLRQVVGAWTTYAGDYDLYYPDYGGGRSYDRAMKDAYNADPSDGLDINRIGMHRARVRLEAWGQTSGSTYGQNGDLRPSMSTYFGGDLDKIAVCPLAIPGWQKGEIDGRTVKLENKDASGNYTFNGGTAVSTYSIWATRNETNVIASFAKVMRKPGQSFSPKNYNPDNLEFQILAADFFAWLNPYGGRSLFGPVSNHYSYGGSSVENGSFADFFWHGWNTIPSEPLSTNYAMADGSIRTYSNLIPNRIKYDGTFHRGHHSKGYLIPKELAE